MSSICSEKHYIYISYSKCSYFMTINTYVEVISLSRFLKGQVKLQKEICYKIILYIATFFQTIQAAEDTETGENKAMQDKPPLVQRLYSNTSDGKFSVSEKGEEEYKEEETEEVMTNDGLGLRILLTLQQIQYICFAGQTCPKFNVKYTLQ